MFRGFKIPTYFIFDGDRKKSTKPSEKASESLKNRVLLKAGDGIEEDFPRTGVYDKYACYEEDFEEYCQAALGNQTYIDLLQPICEQRGYKPNTGMKNFAVVSDLMVASYERGLRLVEVENIIEKVMNLVSLARLQTTEPGLLPIPAHARPA